MDSQAHYEELRALLQSVLQMLGEVLHHLKMGNEKQDGFVSMTGEPFDPDNLPPDD